MQKGRASTEVLMQNYDWNIWGQIQFDSTSGKTKGDKVRKVSEK